MSGVSGKHRNFCQPRVILLALTGFIVFALSGCGGGGFPFGSGGDDQAAPQTVQLVARDIEAPEVFQITQQGLWDGNVSPDGVWVSHPDVTEPGRAIIRNEETGSFVIGALLPAENSASDPSLKVSSDAATTLGMTAETAVSLEVTALRRDDGAPDSTVATETDVIAPIDTTPADERGPDDAATMAEPTTSDSPPARGRLATLLGARSDAGDAESRFVQVGVFSVEDNVQTAADRLRASGIVPTVIPQQSGDSTTWRLIVGPARTEEEGAQILAQIKAQGFNDAFFVNN